MPEPGGGHQSHQPVGVFHRGGEPGARPRADRHRSHRLRDVPVPERDPGGLPDGHPLRPDASAGGAHQHDLQQRSRRHRHAHRDRDRRPAGATG